MQSSEIKTETPKTTLHYEGRTLRVELPYYCKSDDNVFIKVENRNKMIAVHTYDFYTSIDLADGRYAGTVVTQTTPCTEIEFVAAYKQVLSTLYNQPL